MNVNKRTIQRDIKGNTSINELRLLADFLNFDFSSESQRGAKKDLKEFLDKYRLNSSRGKRKGSNLKESLLYYLNPLVATESVDERVTNTFLAVRSYLEMLVNEINHLDLKPRWVIDWGSHRLYQTADGKEYFPPGQHTELVSRPMRKVKNPAYRYLGSGQKKLKLKIAIGDYVEGYEEFIVRKDSFLASSPEQHLYGIIIEALENGEFKRINKCPECQRIFVAEDSRQKYCTPKCKEVRDRRDAPARVRRSRMNKHKKEMRGF